MPFEKHIYLNIAFHTKHAMNLLITKYNYSNKLCPVFFFFKDFYQQLLGIKFC